MDSTTLVAVVVQGTVPFIVGGKSGNCEYTPKHHLCLGMKSVIRKPRAVAHRMVGESPHPRVGVGRRLST